MSADPRPRIALAATAALAAIAALAACDGSTAGSNERAIVSDRPAGLPTATRNAPAGPVRTDTAPLTKRFPALGQPLSARWLSGTLGDDQVPGPTSYWIDAVIHLRPETAKDLRATPGITGVTAPDLPAALKDGLPAGTTWHGGTALDRALPGNGYSATAYLADSTDTLILKATGSG